MRKMGLEPSFLRKKPVKSMVLEMHKEKWPKKWPNKTGKEIPAQVLQKINRPEVGLFFCAKFYCTSFLIPPYPQFSTQLFKNIFLGNFIQIWFRFQISKWKILNPPGYRFQMEKPKNLSCKISPRFWHDFKISSYFVWNANRQSRRSGFIMLIPYVPHLTR